MNTKRLDMKGGYSLVELIVAMGLFSIVMLLATTAYMTLIDMDRNARARSDLTNNFSFALESMARSIRTGTQYSCYNYAPDSYENYYCSPSYPPDCFSFIDQNGRYISYMRKDDGSIGRYIGQWEGDRSCDQSQASSITDPNIQVDTLRFYPRGFPQGDGLQPTVLFTIGGYMNVRQGGEVVPLRFSLQTQATQRQLDI